MRKLCDAGWGGHPADKAWWPYELYRAPMVFDFLPPVFTGDTIRCEVTIKHFEKVDDHTNMTAKWVCYNQKGKEVLTGHTHGLIRDVT